MPSPVGAVASEMVPPSDKPVVEAILGWRHPLSEADREAER